MKNREQKEKKRKMNKFIFILERNNKYKFKLIFLSKINFIGIEKASRGGTLYKFNIYIYIFLIW